MNHAIRCGDFMQMAQTLRPASIDLILTDPPYGQTSLPWDKPVRGWAVTALRLLKPSGSMWVFGSLRHFMNFSEDFSAWKMSHDIVWQKHNGAGFFNDRFRTVHELAAHFYPKSAKWKDVYKEPQFTNDATKRTVHRKETPAHWVGKRNKSHYVSEDGGPKLHRSVFFERSLHGYAEHPTQKPEKLIEPLIRYACPEGGIIFDPFMGSGSIGVAAKALGRHYIGIELNPEYFEIAQRRLEEATCSGLMNNAT
jgi:site-specific DNA-methyltransferase (adenine-specific)